MLAQQKQDISALFQSALAPLLAGTDVVANVVLERPRDPSHGDVACNIAMQLAKQLKMNPRELATKVVEALLANPAAQGLVESADIAGPGFINLRVSAAAKQAVVKAVLAQGAAFGSAAAGAGKKVIIEFVSANPTGPLHVGHGRQAALGDALSSLFQSQGYDVTREFYYNDAGVQIQTLAISVQARLRGLKPGDAAWPESAYNGDYIADIAEDFKLKKTVSASDGAPATASGDVEDIDSIRQFAVTHLRNEQDIDLQAFGVKFDNYYLESSLYSDGKVDAAVDMLNKSGKTYEEEGALWLKTEDYGDDKNRVMRKKDGTYTYFVPDVAYHIVKFQRGFTQAINVQGSDHHGTIARVRAGLQAVNVGIPQGFPDYVLHKMVTVMKGGEEVKISKRAGSYVTLRDLVDWTSRDAVRFFLLSRKADTEFVFDIDLALKQNDENPVFYVQYAHARICSVIRKWGRDLAGAYHAYYAAERVLDQAPELTRARIALLAATRQVLANALAVLGVSAP